MAKRHLDLLFDPDTDTDPDQLPLMLCLLSAANRLLGLD